MEKSSFQSFITKEFLKITEPNAREQLRFIKNLSSITSNDINYSLLYCCNNMETKTTIKKNIQTNQKNNNTDTINSNELFNELQNNIYKNDTHMRVRKVYSNLKPKV